MFDLIDCIGDSMPVYMYRYCIVSACFVLFDVIDALIYINWN